MELKVTWSRAVNIWISFVWRNLIAISLASIISGFIAFGFAFLLPKMGYSIEVVRALVWPLGLVVGLASSILPIKMIINKNYGEFRLVLLANTDRPDSKQVPPSTTKKKLNILLIVFLCIAFVVPFGSCQGRCRFFKQP